jgi:hypothetical protein
MEAITIPKKLIKNDDLIIIPRKEYEYIKSQMIPTLYLKGKAAQRLDKRVSDGLREYKTGKTETLKSFLKRDYPRLYKKYES